MEKKQNDKLELSLDQMDKISGGVTGEEPSDQGEEEENGNTPISDYIPGKRDPHIINQQDNGTIFNPFKNN